MYDPPSTPLKKRPLVRKPAIRWLRPLAFVWLFAWPLVGWTQNLESLRQQKPLRLTGDLTLQSSFYQASGISPRQQPLFWSIGGAPSLHLYGIRIPFLLLLSNQERRFQQPFNQLGIAPYYKWAKLYLGYNQVRFSPYTLAGRRFLGLGMELNPGIFRLGFVYGRFQRATVEYPVSQTTDTSFLSTIPLPVYDRKGYAAKVGVGGKRNYLDVSLLYARDDAPSGSEDSLKAAENLAFGLGFQLSLFSWLRWKTEAGISAFTRDQQSERLPIPDLPVVRELAGWFPPRFSTQVRTAVESSLALEGKGLGLKLAYKRIDKDYKSMGAYYFLTDVEEWTLGPSLNLFKNRFRLSGTVGLQRDNLAQSKARTTRRLIGSAQLSYQPSARFGFNGQYANYGLSQQPVQRSLTDTTLLEQVNQNLTLMPRLSFVSAARTQTLSLVLGYHALADLSQGIAYTAEMKSWFSHFNYHLSLPQKGWNLQGALHTQRVQLAQGLTESIGGSWGLRKSLQKGKYAIHVYYTYFHNRFAHQANGATQNIRMGAQWKLSEKHRLEFQFRQLIHRAALTGPNPSFRESQGRINYQFHFN